MGNRHTGKVERNDCVWPLKTKQVVSSDGRVETLSDSSDSSVV